MDKKTKAVHMTGGMDKDKRREFDFYPTPPNVTMALMKFLPYNFNVIWEPACGNGAMVDILKMYCDKVIATDINMGVDFFKIHYDCDAIITNPPFNLSVEFIKKALTDAPIVAMLLKAQYWHSKGRMKLFNDTLPAWILPLTWRPDFCFDLRHDGKKSAGTMDFQWTVWTDEKRDTIYQPLEKPQIHNTSLQMELL